MSHELDVTTGRAAIAFRGETPWHGLGQELTADADIETWRKEAGLDWEVKRGTVHYMVPTEQADGMATALILPKRFPKRSVLYRSDTHAPLSVVSATGYKVHQPAEILEFFDKITRAGGFQLETAGALDEGRRIWALARVGEGANVVGQDRILPYLLLATSFDGSLATTAKFTCTRVVCANTIAMSLAEPATANQASRVVSQVKVPHNQTFKPEDIKDQLGIVHGAFAQFLDEAQSMSDVGLSEKQAGDIACELLEPKGAAAPGVVIDIRQSKAYRRVLELFYGKAIGANLAGGASRWAFLNAVTQFVDHERGRTRNSGLNSAWFGPGDAMKTEAKELLLAL